MCALSRYERVSEVTRSRVSLASVSDVPDLDKPQSRDGDDEGAEVEASRKRAGMDGVGGEVIENKVSVVRSQSMKLEVK